MNTKAFRENYINYKITKKIYNILKINFIKLVKFKVIKSYNKNGKVQIIYIIYFYIYI